MDNQETNNNINYKTPIYQLIRQIFMLLITIGIGILTIFINFITDNINKKLNLLTEKMGNSTMFYKLIN